MGVIRLGGRTAINTVLMATRSTGYKSDGLLHVLNIDPSLLKTHRRKSKVYTRF